MIDMSATTQRSLEDHLALQYSFNVIADSDGGYVIAFPDLPGCMTPVESLDEIPAMAEEARRLWIETAHEQGHDIPPPSHPEGYSGKFNLRLPRSLHRSLAEAAEHEDVSLNQYVLSLLSRRDSQARIERRLKQLSEQIEGLHVGQRVAVGS
jgi:predicted RNase H-like HicB family nuclease